MEDMDSGTSLNTLVLLHLTTANTCWLQWTISQPSRSSPVLSSTGVKNSLLTAWMNPRFESNSPGLLCHLIMAGTCSRRCFGNERTWESLTNRQKRPRRNKKTKLTIIEAL